MNASRTCTMGARPLVLLRCCALINYARKVLALATHTHTHTKPPPNCACSLDASASGIRKRCRCPGPRVWGGPDRAWAALALALLMAVVREYTRDKLKTSQLCGRRRAERRRGGGGSVGVSGRRSDTNDTRARALLHAPSEKNTRQRV